MKTIEEELKYIFNKEIITLSDIRRAKEILMVWKEKHNWREEITNPIKK